MLTPKKPIFNNTSLAHFTYLLDATGLEEREVDERFDK